MSRFTNLLASVDTRSDRHPALEAAAAYLRRRPARLTILAVLPELTWLARLALPDPEEVLAGMLAQARQRLDGLATPLRDQGFDVVTIARAGRSSTEILREVGAGGHDLVVRINRGAASRRQGMIGSTSWALLRQCPVPVWIVRPESKPHPARIAAAIDPTFDDEPHHALVDDVLTAAGDLGKAFDVPVEVVHCWSIFGEQAFTSHLSDAEMDRIRLAARQRVEHAVEAAIRPHGRALRDGSVHLVKGEAFEVLPSFVVEHEVDLLVMGTVGRSGLAGMVIGNTAEILLDRVGCDILALRPHSSATPAAGGAPSAAPVAPPAPTDR